MKVHQNKLPRGCVKQGKEFMTDARAKCESDLLTVGRIYKPTY
jgi:hypothetical protein